LAFFISAARSPLPIPIARKERRSPRALLGQLAEVELGLVALVVATDQRAPAGLARGDPVHHAVGEVEPFGDLDAEVLREVFV
jgi:hypothetical protein